MYTALHSGRLKNAPRARRAGRCRLSSVPTAAARAYRLSAGRCCPVPRGCMPSCRPPDESARHTARSQGVTTCLAPRPGPQKRRLSERPAFSDDGAADGRSPPGERRDDGRARTGRRSKGWVGGVLVSSYLLCSDHVCFSAHTHAGLSARLRPSAWGDTCPRGGACLHRMQPTEGELSRRGHENTRRTEWVAPALRRLTAADAGRGRNAHGGCRTGQDRCHRYAGPGHGGQGDGSNVKKWTYIGKQWRPHKVLD